MRAGVRWKISLALGLVLASISPAGGQPVTAVPKLDLNAFATGWYEIARLPNKPEKKCVANAFQMIALGDKPGRFQFVQSCLLHDGQTNVRNLPGKIDKAGDGKLKLGSFFPFTTRLWVLATAPGDEWALVGSPNHKTLWVLSRKTKLDAAVLQQVEGVAAAQGYNVSKLQMVVQGK